MEIQAKHPTIGTLLSLIDGKVFSGGNDLKLLHFRPNYFMCQYRVTSKGLALVVLSELGGHAPPPPDLGKSVNPILTRGRGDYAQHICSQVFQTYLRPYQVPGLGPSFEKCEKGKGFPLSFQPKFEFYL